MHFALLESQAFPCGYFSDRAACYEHYLVNQSSPEERALLLSQGYRSFGAYYFRPACDGCQRCVPIRVPIAPFIPSRSQRRVLKRCRDVKVAVAAPSYTEEKYAIYCEHKERFGDSDAGSPQDFQTSFYLPCPGALEFTYRLNGELVAIGLVNEAPDALSSVYFFFRTAHSALSLGTFGVLKEIEAAALAEKQWLYLGYWIEANASMRYKSDFRPNEILGSDGVWRPFRDHKNDYLQSPLTRFQPFPTALSRHRTDRG